MTYLSRAEKTYVFIRYRLGNTRLNRAKMIIF